MKKWLPHILVAVGFVAISFVYFSPLLDGKVLNMPDINNLRGAFDEMAEYRDRTGDEPLWTERIFSGMPAYMVGMRNPGNFVASAVNGVMLAFPRPAGYLIWLGLAFYAMMIGMGYKWYESLLGAVGFAFSSYFFQIMEAGHNSKTHAIAYFPLVALGIFKIMRGHLKWGFLIFTGSMILEIAANHVQMTYYLGLFFAIYVIHEAVVLLKEGQSKSLLQRLGVLILGVLIGVGANAGRLLPTYDYTKDSTRGKSELTIDDVAGVNKTGGLDRDYITAWSYGIAESLNWFIPNFMGGSSQQDLGEDSELYRSMQGRVPNARQIVQGAPTYWGDQPFVAGPYYMGAVMIFLFILALFVLPWAAKGWVLIGMALLTALSWGNNLMFLTDLFIDYFPLYDKFRAVASILTVVMFAIPYLALSGLRYFFSDALNDVDRRRALIRSAGTTGGIALLVAFIGPSLFDFSGANDGVFEQAGLLDALIEDRIGLMRADAYRSFAFVLVAAALLFAAMSKRLSAVAAGVLLTLITLVDMWTVDRRYLNEDDFIAERRNAQLFSPSPQEQLILNDSELGFRVHDLSERLDQSTRTLYFYNAVGGYNAAKLGRYQELISLHLSKNNQEVYNMLNTKYFLRPDDRGQRNVIPNPDRNGAAWFVSTYQLVNNADEEIQALTDFNSKETAIIDRRFADALSAYNHTSKASGSIELTSYDNRNVKYRVNLDREQLTVFSEVYYAGEGKGWKAYKDGVEIPHFRANYILRAAVLPEGAYELEFVFDPKPYRTGLTLSYASSGLYLLLLLLFAGLEFRKSSTKTPEDNG